MQGKPLIALGALLLMSTAALAQTAAEAPQPPPLPLHQPVPEAMAPAPEAAPVAPATGPGDLAKPAETAPAEIAAAPSEAAKGIIAEQDQGQVLGSDLLGAEVVDLAGEKVGTVKDLILDGQQLTGVVVTVGGFLGMGATDVGLGIGELTPTDDGGAFSVAMSREQLEAAPPFMTLAMIESEREADRMRQQQMQQQAQPPISTLPAPQQQ